MVSYTHSAACAAGGGCCSVSSASRPEDMDDEVTERGAVRRASPPEWQSCIVHGTGGPAEGPRGWKERRVAVRERAAASAAGGPAMASRERMGSSAEPERERSAPIIECSSAYVAWSEGTLRAAWSGMRRERSTR